ncbi:MAG TPA: YdcF family protein [Gemmatimonadaceae bacterium]|nr:YdcF family protein [Gemmatimonadaceae bacterium]
MSESPRQSIFSRVVRAIALVVITAWIASLAAVMSFERRDDARPADAIVVLGAAQYDGRPSPVLRARLDHALSLWERHLAPRLILTGGMGDGDTTSEAAVGRRYVVKHGVPDSVILTETRGRTTAESIQRVAAMMDSVGHRQVLLVSDPFHMLRLWILAKRFDLVPHTSPTRTSPISSSRVESWRYSLSESVKAPLTLLFEHPKRQD